MTDILISEQEYIKISTPSLSASLEFKQQVQIYENIDRILVDDGIEAHLKEFLVSKKKQAEGGFFRFYRPVEISKENIPMFKSQYC